MKNLFKITIFTLFLFPVVKGYSQIDTVFKVLTVNQVDNGVLVSFTIRGGVTCSGVKIQRSADGINFEDVFEFIGVCGAIGTDESYGYTDTQPIVNTTSWYRLDLSSLHIYSEVLSIRYIDYGSEGSVVFPNPCRNDCVIYFTNKTSSLLEIILYNQQGATIHKESTKNEKWNVSALSLPTGYYYYKIFKEKEERFVGKIVIL